MFLNIHQSSPVIYESNAILKSRIMEIKKQFNSVADEDLRLKEHDSQDSIELIQATSISPLKVAYYRRFVTLRIEN